MRFGKTLKIPDGIYFKTRSDKVIDVVSLLIKSIDFQGNITASFGSVTGEIL